MPADGGWPPVVEAAGIAPADLAEMNYAQVMKAAEAAYLVALLNATEGNKTLCAERAGMSYATFCRKVAALGLRPHYALPA